MRRRNGGVYTRHAIGDAATRYNAAMLRRLPSRPLAVSALSVAMLAACANSPAVDPQSLKEADASYLNRQCKLLGTVNGRSIFGGLSEDTKIQAAVKDARAKAAAMGATHILMIEAGVSGVAGIGEARARAYRCDATP